MSGSGCFNSTWTRTSPSSHPVVQRDSMAARLLPLVADKRLLFLPFAVQKNGCWETAEVGREDRDRGKELGILGERNGKRGF